MRRMQPLYRYSSLNTKSLFCSYSSVLRPCLHFVLLSPDVCDPLDIKRLRWLVKIQWWMIPLSLCSSSPFSVLPHFFSFLPFFSSTPFFHFFSLLFGFSRRSKTRILFSVVFFIYVRITNIPLYVMQNIYLLLYYYCFFPVLSGVLHRIQ